MSLESWDLVPETELAPVEQEVQEVREELAQVEQGAPVEQEVQEELVQVEQEVPVLETHKPRRKLEHNNLIYKTLG
jgi:hypothetical protein